MSFIGSYEKDNIAEDIVSQWDQFTDERDAWIKRTEEVRQYVTAPDTRFTEVGKSLPWKNKTTIPKLTQIHDNLLAEYMRSTMPTDDWFVFQGFSQEDQEKDSLIEQYIRGKLEQSGWRSTLRKLLSDWIIYGMACVGVEHVTDKVKGLRGNDLIKYHGAKGFRVSPHDFAIDPRASNYDESVFIRRRLTPLNLVLKQNDTNTLIKYDTASVEKAVQIRQDIRFDEEYLKDSSLSIDGFSSGESYLLSGNVEVMEFWGDIYNPNTQKLDTNQLVIIADRSFVLYHGDNPMVNGKKPYSISGWRERPDNLYSQSPLEQLVGMQYRIDHLENVKADVFDLTAHPIAIVSGTPTEDFEWRPNFIYYAGTEGGVNILRPDPAALTANTEIAQYFAWMEEMAGAPKQMAGHRTAGEKTAYEVGILQEGGMKMFLEKSSHFEDTLIEPFLENFYTLTASNFLLEDVIRSFNNDLNAVQIMQITEDDIIADGILKPMGSKHYEKRARLVQELRNFANDMANNPATAPHMDGLALARTVEKELGVDKYQLVKEFKAITDGIDAQMVAQLHQQEVQNMMAGGQQDANMQGQLPPEAGMEGGGAGPEEAGEGGGTPQEGLL